MGDLERDLSCSRWRRVQGCQQGGLGSGLYQLSSAGSHGNVSPVWIFPGIWTHAMRAVNILLWTLPRSPLVFIENKLSEVKRSLLVRKIVL